MQSKIIDARARVMSRPEFVVFIAALVAVNALGVDLMLPALSRFGEDLTVNTANQQQLIITSYMVGLGVGQLIYGPLTDRFGRKPLLLAAMAGFIVASIYAAGSTIFPALLGARVLQGLMSASTRVLAVAITRDSYAGREMAQTMSLAQMIFFLIPVLAPAIGELILMAGPWRLIFYALSGYAGIVGLWSLVRLSETLPPMQRLSLSLASMHHGCRTTLTNRYSIGYALASALTFGGIVAFVSSAPQIFTGRFHVEGRSTLLFAACALSMGCASFANSKLVERLGPRLISQSAIVALIGLSVIHSAVIATWTETLTSFMIFQSTSMACIALCGANFGPMAMDPMGHIAGTASSIQGFITMIGAVLVSSIIGQSYDGTTWPLTLGNACIGVTVGVLVCAIEEGRFLGISSRWVASKPKKLSM